MSRRLRYGLQRLERAGDGHAGCRDMLLRMHPESCSTLCMQERGEDTSMRIPVPHCAHMGGGGIPKYEIRKKIHCNSIVDSLDPRELESRSEMQGQHASQARHVHTADKSGDATGQSLRVSPCGPISNAPREVAALRHLPPTGRGEEEPQVAHWLHHPRRPRDFQRRCVFKIPSRVTTREPGAARTLDGHIG